MKRVFDELISVIIPVYNVEKYIEKCINSVLEQTYKNLEVLLVDDGSTDRSGKICDLYAEKDSRIHVLHKENGGLSSARNFGLERIIGKYIFFLDSDDYIDSGCVEFLYQLMQENDCDIAQTMLFDFSEEREVEGKRRKEEKVEFYTGKQMCEKLCDVDAMQYVVVPNKLYKSNLFDGIRFPCGKLHEDEFTTYKIYWRSKKCAVSHTALYNYRKNNNDSITGREFSPNRLDGAEAMNERRHFFKNIGEEILYEKTSKLYYDYLLYCEAMLLRSRNQSYIKIVDDVNKTLCSEIPILLRMRNLNLYYRSKTILKIICSCIYSHHTKRRNKQLD